jgi:hypothetical protein
MPGSTPDSAKLVDLRYGLHLGGTSGLNCVQWVHCGWRLLRPHYSVFTEVHAFPLAYSIDYYPRAGGYVPFQATVQDTLPPNRTALHGGGFTGHLMWMARQGSGGGHALTHHQLELQLHRGRCVDAAKALGMPAELWYGLCCAYLGRLYSGWPAYFLANTCTRQLKLGLLLSLPDIVGGIFQAAVRTRALKCAKYR